MSMSNEDLERTGLYRTLMESRDEGEGTLTDLEEIKERLDYMDIDESKKNKYLHLIAEIQKEKDEKTKRFLFHAQFSAQFSAQLLYVPTPLLPS